MTTPPRDPGPPAARTTDVVTTLTPRLGDEAFDGVAQVGTAPGHYLRVVLDVTNTSQAQLAARTGLSAKHINQVVQGLVSLSPETALLLERALGVPSTTWNALEAAYQGAQARERSHQELSKHASWLKRFPLKELQQRGIVDAGLDVAGQVAQLLAFFQVADPTAYDRVWSGAVASGFRRASHLTVDPFATAAWLRLAEQKADRIDLAAYSAEHFGELLPTLRSLTLLDDDQKAFASLAEQCAKVGVAVVFVPEVKGTRACGAARWPRSTHPMIVLSGRHQYADILWFSFFHEAAHILLHPKRETYIDMALQGDDDDGMEGEADRAAARYLVGPGLIKQLHPGLRHDDVRQLANETGVDAGIVAGQLCHVLNDYVKYGRLRRKINLINE